MISPILVAMALRAVLPRLEESRVDSLSDNIAAVSDTYDDAARLVVTVIRESEGRREVEDCRVTGDHGASVSGYQLQRPNFGGHSRSEICTDPELAAALALKVLRRRHDVRVAFARYIGAPSDNPEVAVRVRLYGIALAMMGVVS